MKRLRQVGTVAALVCLMFVCMGNEGCTVETADREQRQQTEQLMQEANRQVGMAAIKNFQERKLFKMILELRDREDLVCYAYFFNEREGKLGEFIGRCIGFGLPASIQYTNPDRVATEYGYNPVVGQPDPNGLFMPEGLSATWLMLIDKDGEARPAYFEPLIVVSPVPLHDMSADGGGLIARGKQ